MEELPRSWESRVFLGIEDPRRAHGTDGSIKFRLFPIGSTVDPAVRVKVLHVLLVYE